MSSEQYGRRQVGEGVANVARHNAALEAELARSRDHVGKVRAALVEMTGDLTDRVEARLT